MPCPYIAVPARSTHSVISGGHQKRTPSRVAPMPLVITSAVPLSRNTPRLNVRLLEFRGHTL